MVGKFLKKAAGTPLISRSDFTSAAPRFAGFEAWAPPASIPCFVTSPARSFVLHILMPHGLHRYYGAGYLHFITTNCYRRRPLLGTAHNRDLFLQVLEDVRRRYRFVIAGYVVMPEHVHLLLGEPERGNPSVVIQVLKQSFARRLLRRLRSRGDGRQTTLWSTAAEEGRIWQHRFYDFVVFTEKKRIEKLGYMHQNPVQRGLVLEPEEWAWSSFRYYSEGEPGPVLVNESQKAELRTRKIA
jgi:putative transposase